MIFNALIMPTIRIVCGFLACVSVAVWLADCVIKCAIASVRAGMETVRVLMSMVRDVEF